MFFCTTAISSWIIRGGWAAFESFELFFGNIRDFMECGAYVKLALDSTSAIGQAYLEFFVWDDFA